MSSSEGSHSDSAEGYSSTGGGTLVTGENEYMDTLPSMNLSLEPIEDLIVRFGVAKVMARPQIGNTLAGTNYLVPTTSLAATGPNFTATIGNARLRIERPDEAIPVNGDSKQLEQLVRNLVDNALKYGEADKPVVVSLIPGKGEVELAVSDGGPGIPPEHLPHLTRRFYRTDPGRSRQAGGTGLGLAIVKHIVERHRARLDIVSQPGEGTRVSVRFAMAGETDAGVS